jgi:hypothetical protein
VQKITIIQTHRLKHLSTQSNLTSNSSLTLFASITQDDFKYKRNATPLKVCLLLKLPKKEDLTKCEILFQPLPQLRFGQATSNDLNRENIYLISEIKEPGGSDRILLFCQCPYHE